VRLPGSEPDHRVRVHGRANHEPGFIVAP
jgi:hypothetical protein